MDFSSFSIPLCRIATESDVLKAKQFKGVKTAKVDGNLIIIEPDDSKTINPDEIRLYFHKYGNLT